MTDLDRARREQIRWRILATLNISRPQGANEGLILAVLNDIKLQVTQKELRCELDYLAESGMLIISGQDSGTWVGKLTPRGIDIAEHTEPAPAGIGRPQKYY
ncbi:MAG: hypothetical protein JNM52_11070 [Betaproteobacteria bacterium]|nr:hypothetical protein [Betaproteobacteria bacterium]